MIIIRSEGESTQPLAISARMPVAVSDSRVHGLYPCVVADETASARLGVEHLLNLGHRTVHHLAGPPGSEPARLRATGWRSRLEEAGITPPEPVVGDWTPESGYRAGQVLAADPTVTAVLCGNDEMAFGLMRALHERGRSVPDDVSVVGFDGIALSDFAIPSLTTIRQDFQKMGAELVRMVLDQIGHPGGTKAGTVPDVIVPSHLLARDSSAPPRL